MNQRQETPIVYDPRGIVEAVPQTLAKRVKNLDGLRVAVLDNAKWNAGALLRKTAEHLGGQAAFAAINFYRKESFSKYAAPELIATIAADNDVALTAIGD